MAFTYDKINDMENIVKATGLSEDELASLIIAKENEGWTNAEIADLLASNFDNKEYAGKAQNELDALYSLGFNPSKDYNPTGGKRYQQWQEYKEDPSLIDRFKSWFASNKDADEQRNAAARESIAKSVNDWRDSHPEQWRVGMVNAMFGDNSLLSQYYSAKQAAEEGEKNRQAQREYNQYLKDYDRNKALTDEFRADKVEYSKLQKERATADPRTKVVIDEQMKNIEDTYKDTPYASYFNSENTSKMDKASEAAAKRESQRSNLMMQFKAALDKATSFDEKMKILDNARKMNEMYGNVNAYNEAGFENPWTEEDLAELAKYAEGVETTQDALHKNAQNNLIKDVNEEREKKKEAQKTYDKLQAKLDKNYVLTPSEEADYNNAKLILGKQYGRKD